MPAYRFLIFCSVLLFSDFAHAGWLQEAQRFAPIYKFDGSSKEYCYPDYPSSSNDNTCLNTLSANTPSFVQASRCGGVQVFTYWLWYGKQRPCFLNQGGHGNDWEHVSVFCQGGKTIKVIFHQHSGHYTRRRGTFDRVGERPVVYVGKVAHGSYHASCNGRCSFSEFFTQGCLGSVNYCQGGCGYWDDFRNPGPTLDNYKLHDLRKGETIAGIKRPDRTICVKSCEGASTRILGTAGCWKDKP